MHYRTSLEGYHGTNAYEAVHKISTKDTGVEHHFTKTANFSYTYEKTYLAVYYLLAGDTSQVSDFFPDINKNE